MSMEKRKHWQFDPDHRINFGKHQGTRYRDVPDDYLRWFAENGSPHMAKRKSWASKELARRETLTKAAS